MNALDSLRFFGPELFLLAGAFAVLFCDFFVQNKKAIAVLSLFILTFTALLARAPETQHLLFSGYFTLDAFTHFFRQAALGIVGITVLASMA